MTVKKTSERQVTLPMRVLNILGVGPGDQLEIEKAPDGVVLRPRSIDESRLDGLDVTATTDENAPMLDLLTVKIGGTAPWKRNEIYGSDGR